MSGDDLDLAMYQTVHDFKGGPRVLSNYLTVRPGTLSNKVDPGCEHAHLTVRESVALQLATKDYRIVSAEAHILGGSFIKFDQLENVGDAALLDAYLKWVEETGETAKAVREAIDDGNVTKEELALVSTEIREDIQAGLSFLERFKKLVVSND